MISQPELSYFLASSLLLIIAPGPDIIFLITQSVRHGSRAGLFTALGLSSGNLVHTLAAAIGVSAIIQASTLAFTILKILGAMYLLYLAYQIIASTKTSDTTQTEPIYRSTSYFRNGLLLNVLNPKVALFFLAFLPQFIPSSSTHPQLEIILLGALFALMVTIIFGSIGLFSGKVLKNTHFKPSHYKILNWIVAAVFALLAINLLLSNDI